MHAATCSIIKNITCGAAYSCTKSIFENIKYVTNELAWPLGSIISHAACKGLSDCVELQPFLITETAHGRICNSVLSQSCLFELVMQAPT
jgi:hypothetical protein